MEPTVSPTHSRSKDFILNFGAIVTLYTSVGALFDVIFTVIDKAYPAVTGYGYYSSSSISFPVALLIVVFPLYMLFMWALEKNNREGGAVSGVRRFFSYITIGLSGGLVAGNLITILYKFIDGQELTAAFLFKVLGLSCIALIVFWYYISDSYGKIVPPLGKVSAFFATCVVAAVIIVGFSVIGSPRTQRLAKYDQAKISDFRMISENIQYFVEENKRLPVSLADLKTNYVYGGFNTNDSQTGASYEYVVLTPTSYNLCAVFNGDSDSGYSNSAPYSYVDTEWNAYKKGRYCFTKTIMIKP